MKFKYLYIWLFTIIFILCLSTVSYSTSIILHWDANNEEDLTSYKLYSGSDSRENGGYTKSQEYLIDTILKGTQIYTIENAQDGIHYFSLTATDTSNNESGFSNEVIANVQEEPPIPPETHSIVLAWDANTEEDLAKYRIYHGTISRENGGYSIPDFVDEIPAETETYIFENAEDGIHYFSLTAVDTSDNESLFSIEIWTVVPEFPSPQEIEIPVIIDVN